MSFPIAHSLVGCAFYRMGKTKKRNWKEAVFFAFAATAADMDYLPGILVGRPLLFHQSITHSIGFALIFGFSVALLAKAFKKGPFLKLFLLSSAIYATHPLLDLFTSSKMPLLWPLYSVDLSQQLMAFHSLPLCRDGLKNFACGQLNFSRVQRLGREIFFLSAALPFFFSRAALRFFSTPSKRRPVFTDIPTACAD